MRIGIVLHPYDQVHPGGLARAIFGWTRALLSVDEENEYVIFLKEAPRRPPELPGTRWKLAVLGSGYLWLNRLSRYPDLDVVVFHTPVVPLVYRPRRTIVVAYDFPYKHLPACGLRERALHRAVGWYHRRSLRRADHIVTTSESTKRDVIELFGISPERVSAIYHGFPRICDVPERALALPERFFLFAAVIKERKNVLNILRAFTRFRAEHPGAPQHMVFCGRVGAGAYARRVAAYINAAALTPFTHVLGHLDDGQLSYVYRRAEALVFPSLIEGFGLPILEAMSCGVPVITSNVFAPAELGAGGAALLVDPYDVEDIARAMGTVVDEPEARARLVAKGLMRSQEFTWEDAGRKLREVICAVGTAS
ncbi:MAG: glycosyltransferase family 1 protein [Patescibacteria group bacterium]|nr:glycosyltransferase family 1 protein [Patescibacteria group bacterium]